MNAMEIKNMMCEMADKPLTTNDTVVMDYIMQVYCQTAEIDHEEIRFLWKNYLQNGILDFPTAKKMAMKRLSAQLEGQTTQKICLLQCALSRQHLKKVK